MQNRNWVVLIAAAIAFQCGTRCEAGSLATAQVITYEPQLGGEQVTETGETYAHVYHRQDVLPSFAEGSATASANAAELVSAWVNGRAGGIHHEPGYAKATAFARFEDDIP